MRLKNYKADLLKQPEDPHYAAEYLGQVLAEKDSAAFLIALKDVVEAEDEKSPARRFALASQSGQAMLF